MQQEGRAPLNDDPEKQRGRPKTSHTDENCVVVEGLIRKIEESQFMKRIAESSWAILHIPWTGILPSMNVCTFKTVA
jgi:hypothetical protein